MTSASPMPSLENVSQESPRVRAAMRVLGIHRKDLEVRSRESFEKDFSKEAAEARYETFERKRRHLLKQIVDLSHNTKPSGDVSTFTVNNDTFLQEVMAREAANLQKLRERGKHDVRNICMDELAIKNQAAETLKKQEEQQKKLKENQKAIQDKLKLQRAEADKKKEKGLVNRERADAHREESAQKLMADIKASNEKKEGLVRQKIEVHHEHVAQKAEAWKKISARQDGFMAQQWCDREHMYADYLDRHEKSAEGLATIIQKERSKYSGLQAKLDSAVIKARELQEKQDKDRRGKHEQFVSHEQVVRDRKVEDNTKKWQEIIGNRRKAEQIYKQRYETLLKEKGRRWEDNSRLTRSFSDMSDLKSSRYLEQSMRVKESSAMMDDLVSANRERNARAHQHHQEQALNKVALIRKRVDDLAQGKFNAQQRRYDAIKNCAIEKMKLEDEVTRIRDAPADRMNKMFDELGLNVAEEKEKKADEEAEEKKAD